LSNPNRPTPQQERAARTHQLFLDTAEQLFVEAGYDAMTMTAVAERAETSIGALYRWFPDKTAVAASLLARYTVEIEQDWSSLIASAHTLTTAKFVESLIDRTREFSQRRPAYFILRDARIKVSRSAAARKTLREAFVQAFQAKKTTLSYEETILIANVVVETVKGFLSVIAATPPNRRAPVTAEFTKMLSLYLEAKFR
jgi:AcrR family transcriptional regulator